MATDFTPWSSLGGGLLIGCAVVLLMLTLGRILGATGLVAGVLRPGNRREFGWRLAVLLGMAGAPVLLRATTGWQPQIEVPASWPALVGGGLLVGLGVSLANGCTSGHGICGLARLSRRSVVATLTFMAAAALTVYVLRHVIRG